jgi:hypothetical protein
LKIFFAAINDFYYENTFSDCDHLGLTKKVTIIGPNNPKSDCHEPTPIMRFTIIITTALNQNPITPNFGGTRGPLRQLCVCYVLEAQGNSRASKGPALFLIVMVFYGLG